MRRRSVSWLLLSVVCFLGAAYLWHLRTPRATRSAAQPAARSAEPAAPATQRAGGPQSAALVPQRAATLTNALALRRAALAHRLTNTSLTVGELVHRDPAILLENALFDTTRPANLPIPDALRAQGDPGTYIVQARGPLDNAFRSALKSRGAAIVSYVPNDAYLVRATASVAQALRSEPETQVVLPYEPYYKLKGPLLERALEETGNTVVPQPNDVDDFVSILHESLGLPDVSVPEPGRPSGQ